MSSKRYMKNNVKSKTKKPIKKNPQKKILSSYKKTKKYIKLKNGHKSKTIKIKKKKISKNKKGGGNINLANVLLAHLTQNKKFNLKIILLSQLHDNLDFGKQLLWRYSNLLKLLSDLEAIQDIDTTNSNKFFFSDLNFNKIEKGPASKIDMTVPMHVFNSTNENFALLELSNFVTKACCNNVIINNENIDNLRLGPFYALKNMIEQLSQNPQNLDFESIYTLSKPSIEMIDKEGNTINESKTMIQPDDINFNENNINLDSEGKKSTLLRIYQSLTENIKVDIKGQPVPTTYAMLGRSGRQKTSFGRNRVWANFYNPGELKGIGLYANPDEVTPLQLVNGEEGNDDNDL